MTHMQTSSFHMLFLTSHVQEQMEEFPNWLPVNTTMAESKI